MKGIPRINVIPITIKEAAERTGRTPWDIYQRTERGEFAFAMLHGRRFVALENAREAQVACGYADLAGRA